MQPKIKKYIAFYLFPNYLVGRNLQNLINRYVQSSDNRLQRQVGRELRKKVLIYRSKGHEVAICADGMDMYRHPDVEKMVTTFYAELERNAAISSKPLQRAWSKYIEICNSISFLIECASHYKRNCYYYEFRELDRNDFMRVTYEGRKLKSLADYSQNSLYAAARTTLSKEVLKRTKYNYVPLPLGIFDDMFKVFFRRIVNKPQNMEFVSVMSKCLSNYNLKNYKTAFLLSWILVESYISELWMKAISKYGTKRKKKLIYNKEFTVSVQSEILEIKRMLKKTQYTEIENLRKIRNAIVHRGHKCTKSESLKALDQLKKISLKRFNIDFTFSTSGHSTLGL